MRLLRVRLTVLERALKRQQQKRQRAETEAKDWKTKYEKLEQEHQQLRDQLEKTEHQRDTYRGLLFKANASGKAYPAGETPRQPIPGKAGRGAKPGHPGTARPLPARADKTLRVYLTRCPDCHQLLSRAAGSDDHLVEDLPPQPVVQAVTCLYRVERQWCRHCHKQVKAQARFLIPHARFGLNLLTQILVKRYLGEQTIPKLCRSLRDTFGIVISPGGIVNQLHRARDWLGEDYRKILNQIRASPVKHADETGWRVDGLNTWVWAFLTQNEVYLTIEESRGKGVPEEKLAGVHEDDVLVRDDYGGYQALPLNQQSCWAHLLRKSKEESQRDQASEEVKQLHQQLKQLYTQLEATIKSPFEVKSRLKAYQSANRRLTEIQTANYQRADTGRVQTRIQNQGKRLLTALLHPHVPLTNNLAERALRPLVITRKLTGGSRSPQGAKTHAVNLSIIQTIQARNQPLLSTLKQMLYHGATGQG